MSAIGTYNYNLAKFLVPISQPLSSNQFTVHSSFSFTKKITSYKSTDKFMVSFDFTSLFTTIPLDGSIHIILDRLFKEIATISLDNCSFNRSQLRSCLSLQLRIINSF